MSVSTLRVFLPLVLGVGLLGCEDELTKTGDDTGEVVDDLTDGDGDGYDSSEDCNDSDASINPSAVELCDGIDNDCDEEIDEEVTSTYYADEDGDGFGNESEPIEACEQLSGYVPNGNDCDDESEDSYPGATELCDELDNDCDEEVDEDL